MIIVQDMMKRLPDNCNRLHVQQTVAWFENVSSRVWINGVTEVIVCFNYFSKEEFFFLSLPFWLIIELYS